MPPASSLKKRIIFVDDEPNILAGIQNLLRNVWEMVFALGGEAALAEMKKAPFDVVVSDMRMPGMDGAALLERVRNEYPATARIVLSGHAEPEVLMRAVSVAHQFLSKPCDADNLRGVIERTCDLQALLSDDGVRRVVGAVDKLPAVPATYVALTQAVSRSNTAISDIAGLIEQDPAMLAKVLQLVNSAYFGLSHRVSSGHEAVIYLGVETLKGLTLTAHVFAAMEKVHIEGFSLDRLQRRSLLAARVARRFFSDTHKSETAFTAAILHDIGQVVLALSMPEPFAGVVAQTRSSGKPLHQVEKEMLGVTHAETGAYLLGLWGLPFPVIEAVAFHHRPSVVAAGDRQVLAAIHVADILVDAGPSEGNPGSEERIDLAFLESAGVAGELPKWRASAEEELRSIHG
jgi:HD-like signal output (HDOD) protein